MCFRPKSPLMAIGTIWVYIRSRGWLARRIGSLPLQCTANSAGCEMAFSVRIFGYQGMSQVPQLHLRQFTGAGVFLLEEPFVFGQTISVSNVSELSVANADTRTKILRVEVPDQQAVRYRIIPAGYPATDADTDCPRISGFDNFVFHPGWRIALIDAAGLP